MNTNWLVDDKTIHCKNKECTYWSNNWSVLVTILIVESHILYELMLCKLICDHFRKNVIARNFCAFFGILLL